MDSINREQPEDNHETLQGQRAADKIKEIAKDAKTCFFCTLLRNGEDSHARPMSVRDVDDQGNLWFLSANDSHKNLDLESDPTVKLYFQASSYSGFLELTGRARVFKDREKIDELWQPMIKTWFTEGKDDPRITIIQVTPEAGYYWDNKHGDAIAGIKVMIGAAIGKTLDDSVEGILIPSQESGNPYLK